MRNIFHSKPNRFRSRLFILFLLFSILFIFESKGVAETDVEALADHILNETGVQGGLIAHVGCGDGKLTAALGRGDAFRVHGLDTAIENVTMARRYIQSLGRYGTISVERFHGNRLPYTDNLVNLLVSEDLDGISMDEVMRVLVPLGMAYIKENGEWKRSVKPWPDEMDEWTHYLHDASGNAVADDTLVGPPKHLQWVCGPLYARSHEIDATVGALVSAQGRLFYILDEGLIGITDERLPQQWALAARDAFNGALLWKRPLPQWGWREWKREELEGKDWTGLRGQRTRTPQVNPRRLAADGNRVYFTLGYDAPVSELDAATGDTIRIFENTKGADEILLREGVLYLCIRNHDQGTEKRRTGNTPLETIQALRIQTGEVLWKETEEKVLPLSLAMGKDCVVYNNFKEIVCRDVETGAERWRAPAAVQKASIWGSPVTLVVYQDLVLFAGPNQLEAFSIKNGQSLWKGPGVKGPGVSNPPDLFVADGLVWAGGPDNRYGTNVWLDDTSVNTYTKVSGKDPWTGKVKKTIEVHNLITPGHHFRCYRSKATERYLLWPKRGVEFLDLESDNHMRHDWLRPTCKLGFMPCNGSIYIPPHQCFCYQGVKLNGFNALVSQLQGGQKTGPEKRFEKGSAFPISEAGAAASLDAWPAFRHDSRRSGCASTTAPVEVDRLWETQLGGKLTQPIAAGGKLFLSSVDTHTIYALNADTGTKEWSFTTGGRVDSPPAFYEGMVLAGSADGWFYCLSAANGELIWRFRAAPEDRRIFSFGQLESAWPVHGSPLILDGVVYCSAGRSSYLDGGIYVYGLNPRTGAVLYETCLDGPDPNLPEDIGRPFDMEGAWTDVLVTDGTYLYMQQIMLDRELNLRDTPRITNFGDRKMGRHIFSTAGFLDDSGWNRTFWMYSERWPGYYIGNQAPKAGQLLVFDEETTYGVKTFTRRNRHSVMFFPATDGYLLFADDNDNEPALVDAGGNPKPVKWLPDVNPAIGHTLDGTGVDKDKATGFIRTRAPKWNVWIPVRVRAMVQAGEILFAAGPPDTLDPSDPLAAFEGRKGGILCAFSAKDGKQVVDYSLESPPVFDGLIAAYNRLFMAARDGNVICYGKK